MNQKIIQFPQNKNHKNRRMLFFVILVGAIVGMVSWQYFVENVASFDVQIPESKNITFNQEVAQSMTTAQIANEFEKADGKPVLLYIYATWCRSCTKNFPVFNEIAREFQNTELQVIAIAIDRNMDEETLKNYLGKFGDYYFQPRYLAFKDGFLEFLNKKNIKYTSRIPFTVLISRDGEVKMKYAGGKSKNYLRNKVIKELYL
jgi:thiol-disulfide isomerase/thioredoxin